MSTPRAATGICTSAAGAARCECPHVRYTGFPQHHLGADTTDEDRNRDERQDSEENKSRAPHLPVLVGQPGKEKTQADDRSDDREVIQQQMDVWEVQDAKPLADVIRP